MNNICKALSVAALGLGLSVSQGLAENFKMLTAWGPNHSGTANMAYGYIDLVYENRTKRPRSCTSRQAATTC